MRPEAAAVVREMCKYAMIYLIAHVTDDLGEATVRGALEAGGVTGSAAGQVGQWPALCVSVCPDLWWSYK